MRQCHFCKEANSTVGEAAVLNVWAASGKVNGFSTQIIDLCQPCVLAHDKWLNEHLSVVIDNQADLAKSFWQSRGKPIPTDCLP